MFQTQTDASLQLARIYLTTNVTAYMKKFTSVFFTLFTSSPSMEEDPSNMAAWHKMKVTTCLSFAQLQKPAETNVGR